MFDEEGARILTGFAIIGMVLTAPIWGPLALIGWAFDALRERFR